MDKMIWYYYLVKNFPHFVVICTVKAFCVVNEAEVDVFLEFPCFHYDPTKVGNMISSSSAFPACTSGSSWFMYYWSLAWRILNITLPEYKMSAIAR